MIKLAVIVLIGIIAVSAISDDDVMQQWGQFQKEFGKSYKSSLEERRRLSIFKANLEEFEAHNERYARGEETYTKGVNQFADWTAEEFLEYVNKFQMVQDENDKPLGIFKASENFTAPESVDWRAKGAVAEVKNQGQCGSCWSFSATGAIEGLLKIKHDRLISLSEQNLIDCVTSGSYGCQGGLMTAAFQYVKEKGIVTEQEYPYEARQKSCRQKRVVAKVTGYVQVDRDEKALEEAVAKQPVSIGYEATGACQAYTGGILDDKSCRGRPNHGVLIVGYGEENGRKYWIIKNSWGASWGEKGYFRVIRGKSTCSITSMASYPTL